MVMIIFMQIRLQSFMIKVRLGSVAVRFRVRVSFTFRVSLRVIKLAILSCNGEAT